MPEEELEVVNEAVERAVQAAVGVLTDGITSTMNRFN